MSRPLPLPHVSMRPLATLPGALCAAALWGVCAPVPAAPFDELDEAARRAVVSACLPERHRDGIDAYHGCVAREAEARASGESGALGLLELDERYAVERRCAPDRARSEIAWLDCVDAEIEALARAPAPRLTGLRDDERHALLRECFEAQSTAGVAAWRGCMARAAGELRAAPAVDLSALDALERGALLAACATEDDAGAGRHRRCLLERGAAAGAVARDAPASAALPAASAENLALGRPAPTSEPTPTAPAPGETRPARVPIERLPNAQTDVRTDPAPVDGTSEGAGADGPDIVARLEEAYGALDETGRIVLWGALALLLLLLAGGPLLRRARAGARDRDAEPRGRVDAAPERSEDPDPLDREDPRPTARAALERAWAEGDDPDDDYDGPPTAPVRGPTTRRARARLRDEADDLFDALDRDLDGADDPDDDYADDFADDPIGFAARDEPDLDGGATRGRSRAPGIARDGVAGDGVGDDGVATDGDDASPERATASAPEADVVAAEPNGAETPDRPEHDRTQSERPEDGRAENESPGGVPDDAAIESARERHDPEPPPARNGADGSADRSAPGPTSGPDREAPTRLVAGPALATAHEPDAPADDELPPPPPARTPERPPARDFGTWLASRPEEHRRDLAVEFLIYWMAWGDERYEPSMRDAVFADEEPDDATIVKRRVLEEDVHAFAGTVRWIVLNTSRETRSQILDLLVALLVTDPVPTPLQNTLLRFLADVFGLGVPTLEARFLNAFDAPLPPLPRVDRPDWWAGQDEADMVRHGARAIARASEATRHRARLGLPLTGEIDAEAVLGAFGLAARRTAPERFDALGERERGLAARQLDRFADARDALLEGLS